MAKIIIVLSLCALMKSTTLLLLVILSKTMKHNVLLLYTVSVGMTCRNVGTLMKSTTLAFSSLVLDYAK